MSKLASASPSERPTSRLSPDRGSAIAVPAPASSRTLTMARSNVRTRAERRRASPADLSIAASDRRRWRQSAASASGTARRATDSLARHVDHEVDRLVEAAEIDAEVRQLVVEADRQHARGARSRTAGALQRRARRPFRILHARLRISYLSSGRPTNARQHPAASAARA